MCVGFIYKLHEYSPCRQDDLMFVRYGLREVFWKCFSKLHEKKDKAVGLTKGDCVNLRIHLMCRGFTETAFVSRIKWHIEIFHVDV